MEEVKEFPFVGRVAELAHCIRLLRKAHTSDELLTVLVSGERGIGKTRFVQEAAKKSQSLGYRVLLHHCQKWDRHNPFATISALLRLLLGKPPGWVPRSIETMTRTISELFPKLLLGKQVKELLYWLFGGSKLSDCVSNVDEYSRRGILTRLFNEILEQQLQRRPFLLMAVDDIHHSDEFSRSFLLSAVLRKGVAFLISAPSSAAPSFQREAKEVTIPPFSEDEVGLLLTIRFGRAFPAAQFVPELLRITQGNALHLVQLLTMVPVNKAAPDILSKMLEKERPSKGGLYPPTKKGGITKA